MSRVTLPNAPDPALRLEALQRRIKCVVLDKQHVLGGLLDRARDALTVVRAENQCAQDEHIGKING